MPDKEKEKRLRAVKVAKAINSIEGVPIPDETSEFFTNFVGIFTKFKSFFGAN